MKIEENIIKRLGEVRKFPTGEWPNKIVETFKGFGKKVISPAKIVRLNDYYSPLLSLDRLINPNGDPTNCYIYNRDSPCRNFECYCGETNYILELVGLKEKDIAEFMRISTEVPHQLSRNLYNGLTFGSPLLSIIAQRRNRKDEGEGKISTQGHFINPSYDKSLGLISGINSIKVVD